MMSFVNYIVVLVSCLVTLSPFLGFAQHLIMRDRRFYKVSNTSLVGSVTATRNVKDFFDCSFLCTEHDRAPISCVSFNLGKVSDGNGYYNCELSSSERHQEPADKMQETLEYDYYGTPNESLASLLPCTRTPCNYGGTCTHGSKLGEFSCQCGVEVSVLPFIDDQCNVDTNTLKTDDPVRVQGVFYAGVGAGADRYNLNFYDAQRLCEMLGATLATYDQLYAAWGAGFEKCNYGWLSDSTFRYPMQQALSNCGNNIGINGPSTPQDKSKTYDAWCYKV